MNALQPAASAAQRAPIRTNISGAALSPTSPTTPQQRGPARGGHGRKRTLDAAFSNGVKVEPTQQSPTSAAESFEDRDESRIGVKRACNECRQQKLRCDVVQDPFQSCSRCRRCSLECRIDSNFKRVGKRKRNAEMEREIMELRNQLASQQALASPVSQTHVSQNSLGPTAALGQPVPPIGHSPLDQYMGSHEAVASLLDLKSGGDSGFGRSPGPDGKPLRRLEGVVLTHSQVDELFRVFFNHYHPLQPLLNPERSADFYFEQCPLLFWTVISVAARHHAHAPVSLQDIAKGLTHLLWATIADVPQSYLVVKALCMLCVWPLPFSSTSSDPTLMISGLMLQIAMQIGLHRPSHAQDFSKFRVDLREEELKDRVKTWAACNVVAQRVATGYGQPASTHYDWTLRTSGMIESGYQLPDEMDARLRIEIFCDKITKTLYGNRDDPVGFAAEEDKSELTESLAKELEELETRFKPSLNSVNLVYLLAANLHLRLSVFFDSPTSDTYEQDLMHLWNATRRFLEEAISLKTKAGNIVKYSSNYILQIIIACGFTLHKLLNSFFARMVDLEYGKKLFTQTIQTIRQISVVHNDLPSRLAEVLAQLWRAGGGGTLPSPASWDGTMDDTLQLKVRCRMSMSLVYDSVWRWREDFQPKGRDELETALKNPTDPDSNTASTVGTTVTSAAASLAPEIAPINPVTKNLDSMLIPPNSTSISRSVTPSGEFGFGGEWNNEVFDPLNWMLDGVVEFPYVFGEGHELEAGLSAI